MALEPSFALLRGLPGASAAQLAAGLAKTLHDVEAVGSGGLHEILVGGTESGLSVYVPESAAGRVGEIANELEAGHRSPYAALDEHRVLLIGATGQLSDGVRLSGGSHCEVLLRRRHDAWTVTKTVSKDAAADDNDALRRHRNEAEWLAAVGKLSDLFVDVLSIADRADSYCFETSFFPAYSLAELAVQGCLSGTELTAELIAVYEHLRGTLYSRPPLPAGRRDRDRSYLDKIRRRSSGLLALRDPGTAQLVALLTADQVRINGRRCLPLPGLLRLLQTDPAWQPVIHPAGAHACHGDLILEDILLRTGPDRGLKLVDPNPYNTHGIIDLGKTMLSLSVGYELVYFDFFTVCAHTSTAGGRLAVDVDLAFTAGPRAEPFAQAFEQFTAYAEDELCGWFGSSHRTFRREILMTAALTALAIPSFHATVHRRPDRALAFTALGLLLASCVLDCDGLDTPLYARSGLA